MSLSSSVDVATPPRTPWYQPEVLSAAQVTDPRNNASNAGIKIHQPIAPPPYEPVALTLCVLGPGGAGSLSTIVTVALAVAPSVAPPVALLSVSTTVSFG